MSASHNRKKTQVRIEFGKRLRCKRQEQGFTLEALAEKADLDPTSVAFIEQGEGNISLENIITLAQVLKMPLKELMPDI